MRNFIILYILFIPAISLAQSAVLLPNGIDLPKVTTLTTCTTPEKGRMVFNTTNNKAYYCNGTNWQEMTGGGFSLPYSGTANSNSELLKIVNGGDGTGIWAESNEGFGLYAKSINSIAVIASSKEAYGVKGNSESFSGVRGESLESYGVSGYSSGNSGVSGIGANGVSGHANSTNGYGIYGSGVNGRAGYFLGTVTIYSDLRVDEDKGIIQNTNSTQLKYYTRKITFTNRTLSASDTFISDDLSITTFSAKPVVYIGDIENQSDDYYKVTISIVSVDENSIRVRFYNPSNTSITFSGTWNIIAIGPK
jgi:hypothetical protein